MPRGMVIVGNGECGTRAALTLRAEGYVGPITLIGEEACLPYERPPLSKHIVECNSDAGVFKPIASEEELSQAGILSMRNKVAVRIDRHRQCVVLGDGEAVSYDKLLLATGALPRTLPPAHDLSRVHYLRNWTDAQTLSDGLSRARKMIVIGAGFIGLEVAASARGAGIEVTILEAKDRILNRVLPQEICSILHDVHTQEGVRIITGAQIDKLEEGAEDVTVTLADGGRVSADLLVVGIGAVPRIELAASAGLEVDNGIVVDEMLRTTCPQIYAAGDCCMFPVPGSSDKKVRLEAWRNAFDQGQLAAQNMLGGNQPHRALPSFWSEQYDYTIHMVGTLEGEAVRRELSNGAFIQFHLDEMERVRGACGLGKGQVAAQAIKVAERLISAGSQVDRNQLASPQVNLRSLISGCRTPRPSGRQPQSLERSEVFAK